MTLPFQEKIAVNDARIFLNNVLVAKRVPKGVKQQAICVLKHFPGSYRIDLIFKDYFDKQENPVREWCQSYQNLAEDYYAAMVRQQMGPAKKTGRKQKRRKK